MRRMKTLDLLACCGARLDDGRLPVEPLLQGFTPERILPVGPERMTVRETVAAERLADVKQDFFGGHE